MSLVNRSSPIQASLLGAGALKIDIFIYVRICGVAKRRIHSKHDPQCHGVMITGKYFEGESEILMLHRKRVWYATVTLVYFA